MGYAPNNEGVVPIDMTDAGTKVASDPAGAASRRRLVDTPRGSSLLGIGTGVGLAFTLCVLLMTGCTFPSSTAGAASGAGAGAGSGDPAYPNARRVTSEEAELLATTRYRNVDTGSRPFHAVIEATEYSLQLDGWVDFQSLLGYAQATELLPPDTPGTHARGTGAMLWTQSTTGIIEQQPAGKGMPALPIPSPEHPGWSSRALDAESSIVDAFALLMLSLGADRPDNPLLVQQTGALWLGDDEVDGTPVTVFAAPQSDEPVEQDEALDAEESTLRLWVDDEGLLLRAEIWLGSTWVVVQLPDEPGEPLSLTE